MDAFQEVDATGITRSCVKHNFLIRDISEIAMTVKKAFHIATTGRPGPVVIDIPKDITIAKMEVEEYPATIEMRSYKPTIKASDRQIKKAAEMLANSKRPILYAGGGCIIGNASKELRECLECMELMRLIWQCMVLTAWLLLALDLMIELQGT